MATSARRSVGGTRLGRNPRADHVCCSLGPPSRRRSGEARIEPALNLCGVGDALLPHVEGDFSTSKTNVATRRVPALKTFQVASHPALDAATPAVELIQRLGDFRSDSVCTLRAGVRELGGWKHLRGIGPSRPGNPQALRVEGRAGAAIATRRGHGNDRGAAQQQEGAYREKPPTGPTIGPFSLPVLLRLAGSRGLRGRPVPW